MESRTYERLFTPPEVDASEDDIDDDKNEFKKMTGDVIAKMMKLKKDQVDAVKSKVKEDYKETKESRHLQPEDITKISDTYAPILK